MAKPRPEFAVAVESDFSGLIWSDRTGFATPAEMSALQAYLGLKILFGTPNTEFIDETKEQWSFLIKTEDACIQVNDWKLTSWSIHVYERNRDVERSNFLIEELTKAIARSAARERGKSAQLENSPQGHLIENPFAVYYSTAVELLQMAEKVSASTHKLDITESFGALNQINTLCRACFFQLFSAFEGLLNLIYELYMKAELREARIIDRLQREQLDVKLRLAPVYCECFAGDVVDHKTDAFRNLGQLINARNDLIHANVTTRMKAPVVRCDGFTFILSAPGGAGDVVPSSISEVGFEEVKSAKKAVDAIADEVLAAMKPRFRREFCSVMHDEYISVEYDQGVPVLVTG